MPNRKTIKFLLIACAALLYTGCSVPHLVQKKENKTVPESYSNSKDTLTVAKIKWKDFFTDPYLKLLIDTALKNNQELNILQQEIIIAQNEARARKAQYLPFVNIGGGVGVDKMGKFTRLGAIDENINIAPETRIPNPLPDFQLAANVSWEVDIWRKLRNARKAAVNRYLATTAGRNFLITNLVAEVANSYFELMALDNQMEVLKRNIEIQQNALEIVKLEKSAAKVTELAVRRFEAEVLRNQSRVFYIQQSIVQTENRINFLTGRFPQPVLRNSQTFTSLVPSTIYTGIPAQLLENRPDIKQAELALSAAKLDVLSARAYFYPSLNISAAVGLESFKLNYLLGKPESMFYTLTGGLFGPVINRNSIKAAYYTASARQIQAVYDYQRTILRAYLEVANQLANTSNLEKSYDLKAKQVEALNQSINISIGLFKSARADYMEVLLTQRDALESRFELIETKKQQMNAMVTIYQALGGGWN